VHTKKAVSQNPYTRNIFAPTDIHQRLLNVCEEETVVVNTVKCGLCFSAVAAVMLETGHIPGGPEQLSGFKRIVSLSVDPRKSVDYSQRTLYGAECWIQCVGNNVGKVGILQSLCQVGPRTHRNIKTTECKFVWTAMPYPPCIANSGDCVEP
jgi:hypothetical protein